VNVQHQGFIQILPKGTTAKTPTWVWGILKANMLLFKDMKVWIEIEWLSPPLAF
jgi:hypothetical protein